MTTKEKIEIGIMELALVVMSICNIIAFFGIEGMTLPAQIAALTLWAMLLEKFVTEIVVECRRFR